MVSISSMTVMDMVKLFYYVQPYQVVGGPDWMRHDRFDVTGKDSGMNATGRAPSAAEIDADYQQMKGLLIDRFQLALHHEVRKLSVLQLLRNSKTQFREVPCSPTYRLQHGVIQGAVKTSSLAALLKAELRTQVEDVTGLKGCYFMDSHWTTDPMDETTPSVSTALHDLGFRLRKANGEVEVLVIDHVERPLPD